MQLVSKGTIESACYGVAFAREGGERERNREYRLERGASGNLCEIDFVGGGVIGTRARLALCRFAKPLPSPGPRCSSVLAGRSPNRSLSGDPPIFMIAVISVTTKYDHGNIDRL